jgi:Kef-type K+ transport system membrane component KefB
VSRKGDAVSEGKGGRVFDLVTTILFAVIFAGIFLWFFERIKRLWWRWKAKRDDPLWHLRKKRDAMMG